MATICIFGNSHLGALAQAAEANARFADAGHDLFYWGAAGGNFPRLAYAGGTVTSPHPSQARMISGGRCDALEIAPLDILVFYGCHVMHSVQTRRIALALQGAEGNWAASQAFRDAFFDEMVESWWAEQPFRPIAEAIVADFPDKRYLFMPQPLVARQGGHYNKVRDRALAERVQDRLFACSDGWAADIGITALRQPEKTLADALHTDAAYSTGSIKMGTTEAHPGDDNRHMNAAYGQIVMEKLLASL